MDKKDLFTAGIFYTAFLAFLLTGIGFIISPLKEDIRENKSAIAEVRTELNTRMDRLEAKLDQIIFALLKGKVAETKPLKKPSAPLQAVPRDKQAKIE